MKSIDTATEPLRTAVKPTRATAEPTRATAKKVATVSGNYPPTFCGVGAYTGRLVEHLRAAGVDVAVISQNQIDRWRVIDLPKIIRAIRAARPDVVHIQYPTIAYRRNVGINLLPLALRVAMPRRPVVVTLHEYHDTSILGHARTLITALFASRLIVSNQEDLAQIRAILPWKKISLIPIGINVGPDQVDAELRDKLLDRFGLADTPFAAFFAKIDPSKGVEKLIDSLPQWPAGLKLVLISRFDPADPYHARLKEKIAGLAELAKRPGGPNDSRVTPHATPRTTPHVIWTDYLDDAAAASLLSAATLAVQPFDQPVSMRRSSVLSPISLGVPTITTGPLPAPLQNGFNCVGLTDNSPDRIAAAVSGLFNDPKLRKILRSNGLKLAQSFDWQNIAGEHSRIYEEVI